MTGLSGSWMWYLMRASGAVSLILFSVVLALGIASTVRIRLRGLPHFATAALHGSLALLSVVFLAIHVATAVGDPYAQVRLVDTAVPFLASSHRLVLGLGVLGADLIVALVVTSLLRHRIGLRTWRAIHLVAYLSWPLALVHTIGEGSDTGQPWLLAVLAFSILLVAASVIARVAGRGDPARPPAAGRRFSPPSTPVRGDHAIPARTPS
jgi:methionine sulfoxide reductase heme-binding subunit